MLSPAAATSLSLAFGAPRAAIGDPPEFVICVDINSAFSPTSVVHAFTSLRRGEFERPSFLLIPVKQTTMLL